MLRTLAIGCAVLLAQGCVRIEHPLSEVAKEAPAADFVGNWVRQDPIWGPDKAAMPIVATDSGGCRIVDPPTDKEDKHSDLDMRIVSAAGWNFVEFEFVDSLHELGKDADRATEAKHLVSMASIERRGDWIAVRWFDTKALTRFIESGELKGSVEKGLLTDNISIAADAKELEGFLAAHRDEVFDAKYDLYHKQPDRDSNDKPESADARP